VCVCVCVCVCIHTHIYMYTAMARGVTARRRLKTPAAKKIVRDYGYVYRYEYSDI